VLAILGENILKYKRVDLHLKLPSPHNLLKLLKEKFMFVSVPAQGGETSHTAFNLKRSIFWDITPCSLLKVGRRFGGTCGLHLHDRRTNRARNEREASLFTTCFTLVSCLDYSSTLNNDATCTSEMSVDFQWTTWPYIREDRTPGNHRCKNLKSHICQLP
jgi:hypothetical protein